MKIISKFAEDLYSITFTEDELISFGVESTDEEIISYGDVNEFDKFFQLYTDPLYVSSFVDEHEVLFLDEFWSKFTLRDIKKGVLLSAEKFISLIERTQKAKKLDSLFSPLHKGEDRSEFTQVHAYSQGINDISFLRLFAIKIDKNTYLVTGGCVKTAQNLQGSEKMRTELNKLNAVEAYLIAKGIKTETVVLEIV